MLELDAVIASAQKWVGTVEQPPGSNSVPGITDWLDAQATLGSAYDWCAASVSRWLSDGGVNDLYNTQFSNGCALVDSVVDRYQDLGRYDMKPQKGDLVVYEWDGDSKTDHIGLVVGVNSNGTLHTIEGNSGSSQDRVYEYSSRSVENVVGYCHPSYDGQPVSPPSDPPATGGVPYPGHMLDYVPGKPLKYDSAAKQWQQRMKDRGWNIDVDGLYGPQSDAICRKFQAEKGLVKDGIVGPMTWKTAFRTDNVTP